MGHTKKIFKKTKKKQYVEIEPFNTKKLANW